MNEETQSRGTVPNPSLTEEQKYLTGIAPDGSRAFYEWARENQLSFAQFRSLQGLWESAGPWVGYEPQSREEQLREMGLREVTIDLAAEGKAIADVIAILSPLPDYSQGRVFEAVARLVVPQFFEKTNFDFLREVSMEPSDE